MKTGLYPIVFDNSLEPEQRLIIAVFHQCRMDILGKSKKHKLGAELFLRGCGFNIERIRKVDNADSTRDY